MRVTLRTDSYNERRDGKPWICRVTSWPTGASRPEIVWGAWIGSPGSVGTLEIEAEPGDLIRHGQNDLRHTNHTYRQYCQVEQDGTLADYSDSKAKEIWVSVPRDAQGHTVAVSPASPLADLSDEQLHARIAALRDELVDLATELTRRDPQAEIAMLAGYLSMQPGIGSPN